MMPLHYHPVTKSVEVLPLCCNVKKKKRIFVAKKHLILAFFCFHVILRIFFEKNCHNQRKVLNAQEENTSIHVQCITKE